MIDAQGAIIRGDVAKKEIALVFTGDEFADGAEIIHRTLEENRVKASFFFTGNFYRTQAFQAFIRKLKQDGHYLGAHSDKHLLYADWSKRDSLLVSESEFKRDLADNYKAMSVFGIKKKHAKYFLPPFEWYNRQIVEWTKQEGLSLINFSPGTRSHADYTYPELGKSYASTEAIYQSITKFEAGSENALNGFILLLHVGADPRRQDKFYSRLAELILGLKSKEYQFVRIDELIH